MPASSANRAMRSQILLVPVVIDWKNRQTCLYFDKFVLAFKIGYDIINSVQYDKF